MTGKRRGALALARLHRWSTDGLGNMTVADRTQSLVHLALHGFQLLLRTLKGQVNRPLLLGLHRVHTNTRKVATCGAGGPWFDLVNAVECT